MKKISILFLLIILLTGCGENKKNNKDDFNLLDDITLDDTNADYICTTYDKENKIYTLAGKYAIYLDDNNDVSRVESSELIECDDLDKLSELQSYYNSNYQSISNYGGYTFDIYQENNRLISNVIIDYSMFNIESYATDYEEIKNYLNDENKISSDNIIEFYKSKNITCEKKK